MEINLIQSTFENNEAIEILTQIIHVKIKFHENKMKESSSEEEMKMRENRIIKLQKDLFEIRNFIKAKKGNIDIQAELLLA
jgi:hypothetical protein